MSVGLDRAVVGEPQSGAGVDMTLKGPNGDRRARGLYVFHHNRSCRTSYGDAQLSFSQVSAVNTTLSLANLLHVSRDHDKELRNKQHKSNYRLNRMRIRSLEQPAKYEMTNPFLLCRITPVA